MIVQRAYGAPVPVHFHCVGFCRSLCSPWQQLTEEARLSAFAVACFAMDLVVPSRLQQGALLVLAAALVAAGVGGGQWFMEADYVVYGVSVSYYCDTVCISHVFVFVPILVLAYCATKLIQQSGSESEAQL